MKTLIITDNYNLYSFLKKLSIDTDLNLDFTSSSIDELPIIDLSNVNTIKDIVEKYEVVISLHCKQIFPKELYESIRCVNVHPGYNPYNRGWYPHVFSFVNGNPVGVTIHEINGIIDGGDIIIQEQVKIENTDTSLEVYNKIYELEKKLLSKYINDIINNNYSLIKNEEIGNINYKKDYLNFCKIDLNNVGTFKEHIDKLRSLSHGEYKNAYYITDDNEKVFINIKLSN